MTTFNSIIQQNDISFNRKNAYVVPILSILASTFSSYDLAPTKSVISGETPLDKLNHSKDVSKVRKKIALMEANLKELDKQEQKYSAELDAALTEYAELKTQGEQFDPVELYDARQAIRHEKEQNVINRVQRAYGDKYNPLTMFDSKREVSGLLHEYADEQAVRDLKRKQHKYQKEHSQIQPKKTRDEQSR